MVFSDSSFNSRSWRKPYLTTVIAVLVVGGAMTYSNCELQRVGGSWLTCWYCQGWPVICRHLTVTTAVDYDSDAVQFLITTTTTTTSGWVKYGLLIDIAATILIFASTTVACERWRRRHASPWQFSVRSLLMLTAVVASLLILYLNEFAIYWWWSGVVDDGTNCLHGGLQRSPWYIVAPMAFGVACLIASLYSIILLATSKLFRTVIGWRLSQN